MAVQIPGGMSAHVEPINIADLLYKRAAMQGQQQENDYRQQLFGMKQQELAKQQRFADLLAQNKGQVSDDMAGLDADQYYKFKQLNLNAKKQEQEVKQEHMKDLARLAVPMVQEYQQNPTPENWQRIQQQNLPLLDNLGLGDYKQQFMQATPENALKAAQALGVYDPNSTPEAKLAAQKAEYEAMTPLAVDRETQIAATKPRQERPPRMIATDRGFMSEDELRANPGMYKTPQQAEKENKIAAERDDAINQIDTTTAFFNRLKDIQANTTTGPVSSSAISLAVRKALPNDVSGGENLQELEAGYAELGLRAMQAFKAGGVTFGQLSNAEGDWIKKTQASINRTGTVNQKLLQEGIDLLAARKKRLGASGSLASPSTPKTQGLSSQTADILKQYGIE